MAQARNTISVCDSFFCLSGVMGDYRTKLATGTGSGSGTETGSKNGGADDAWCHCCEKMDKWDYNKWYTYGPWSKFYPEDVAEPYTVYFCDKCVRDVYRDIRREVRGELPEDADRIEHELWRDAIRRAIVSSLYSYRKWQTGVQGNVLDLFDVPRPPPPPPDYQQMAVPDSDDSDGDGDGDDMEL